MRRHGPVLILLGFAAAASAQTPAGGEFRVNTYTFNNQMLPAIALPPKGDFIIAWVSYRDGDGFGVFGQRYDASGIRSGGEFQVNSYTTGHQGGIADAPAVGSDASGDFVVVWNSTGQDGSSIGVFGQRFGADGSRQGAEFRVNSHTTNAQERPAIGVARDGRFVVVWSSVGQDGSGNGVFGQRFDANGDPAGGEFRINTSTTMDQSRPTVAMTPDDEFVVVWDSTAGFPVTHLWGQRFATDGSPLGGEFQVTSFTTSYPFGPRIAAWQQGFVVAWWASNPLQQEGIFARRFDAAAVPIGLQFQVNSYTTGRQALPSVASDDRGNFVVAWESEGQDGSSYAIVARRYDSTPAARGPEFLVNSSTTGPQQRAAAGSDAVGNLVVTWMDYALDGSHNGISAQRFGGLGPAALGVDTVGNGVLEPGENVGVRPSWRNFNGAAQTFSGTLTNITGPAGAIYTITDGAGNYGTVADGATAPCTDCYAVSVSNPALRPAVHWDASAVESILPDTHGQQKQWLLHVGDSFTDVPRTSPFYRFIETLLHHGVTGGCSATEYCPASSTTREQMAVFVLVAKEGVGYVPPACTIPVFNDVPASSPFCRWIEELARRGVVSGCGGGNYCPTSAVTREQMAVFVLRTLDPAMVPPACAPPNIYNDVPETSGFCRWIEELARRGVVSGCGGGNYCPTNPVTREQMGVFISVTFGLTLYGP